MVRKGIQHPSLLRQPLSAPLKEFLYRQDLAMTGSLSVRGDVLPVGGVTYKIEAAVKAGIKTVLIPRMNLNDVLIEEQYKSMVTIIPVDTIDEVFKHALVPENMDGFLSKLKKMAVRSTSSVCRCPG